MSPDQVRGVWAIVVAAGRGSRFGGALPKQYAQVDGRPLLAHTLDALLSHPGVRGAVVVLAADDAHWPGWTELHGKPLLRCAGGESRADSVLAGLQALPDEVRRLEGGETAEGVEVVGDWIVPLSVDPQGGRDGRQDGVPGDEETIPLTEQAGMPGGMPGCPDRGPLGRQRKRRRRSREVMISGDEPDAPAGLLTCLADGGTDRCRSPAASQQSVTVGVFVLRIRGRMRRPLRVEDAHCQRYRRCIPHPLNEPDVIDMHVGNKMQHQLAPLRDFAEAGGERLPGGSGVHPAVDE